MGSYLTKLMRNTFQTDNKQAIIECKSKLKNVFSKIDDTILSKKTTRYLGGNELGVADIALAALAGPVVMAREYCAGEFVSIFDELERQDPELREELLQWRNTLTGMYSLELYKNCRQTVTGYH